MIAALEKRLTTISDRKPCAVAAIGIGILGVVGLFDAITGPELALSILYIFPVAFCAWYAGRKLGYALSLLAAIVWTYFDIHDGRPYSNPLFPYWNGCVRLGIFAMIAALVDTIRTLTHHLQELVKQRTAALEAEIRSRKEVERVVTEISSLEQQRLGADLHDQLAGHLTGLAFMAKAIAESLQRRNQPEGADAEQLVGHLNHALKQLRAFCRLLAPVDTGDLEPGLTRLGAQIETAFGVTCIVQTSKNLPPLGLNRARLVYNIAQEAVRNAVEKRMAKHVEIHLVPQGNFLKLTVTDNGTAPEAAAASAGQELPVRVMRYRAETLGGEISVSRSESAGSSLHCTVAIEPDAASQPFPPMS
jgi:signal transduction histidine kinase